MTCFLTDTTTLCKHQPQPHAAELAARHRESVAQTQSHRSVFGFVWLSLAQAEHLMGSQLLLMRRAGLAWDPEPGTAKPALHPQLPEFTRAPASAAHDTHCRRASFPTDDNAEVPRSRVTH